MKSMTKWMIGSLAALTLAASAFAEVRGSTTEAKALADKAAAHVAKVGPEKAFKDFNDKSNTTWQNKDLYVFAYNMNGECQANGANNSLVGRKLTDLKDANGKLIIQEMLTAASKGSGSVDYSWAHPQTKTVEPKTSYVVKLSNYDGFVGVGAYKQ